MFCSGRQMLALLAAEVDGPASHAQ